MSEDWKRNIVSTGTVPLCSKNNIDSYMGTRRKPSKPDEDGAVEVVDLVFGGRYLFFPYDKTHYRVQRAD